MNLRHLLDQLTGGTGSMANLEKVEGGWIVRFAGLRKIEKDPKYEERAREASLASGGMPMEFLVSQPDQYRTYPRAIFCGTWEDVLVALQQADDALGRMNEARASGASIYPESLG